MSRVIALVGWTLVSYALGCVNGAYYLHRIKRGSDIREAGSGNAGARNAWRVMGSRAFLPVFLIDAGKGALASWVAQQLGLDVIGIALAASAVVVGHVFPAQLGFRGGRGIATTLGAIAIADPLVALVGCIAAAIFMLVIRNAVVSAGVAIAALPIIGVALERKGPMMFAYIALSLLVIVAHREELRALMRDRKAETRVRR